MSLGEDATPIIREAWAKPNGIGFIIESLCIEVTRNPKTNKVEIIEKIIPTTNIRRSIKKIPLVSSIYQALMMTFVEYPSIGLILLIWYAWLSLVDPSPKFDVVDILLWFCLGVIITVFKRREVITMLRYHSVEHKLVNCLDNKLPISKEILQQADYFNASCGSLIGIFIILFYVVGINLLRMIPQPITMFLSLFLALEVRQLIGYNKYTLGFARILQRIVCFPPSNDELEVGVVLGEYIKKLKK